MNTMKSKMDQQTELLRLIVQKMEIKSEDDENDDVALEQNKPVDLWSSAFKNICLRNSVLHQLNTSS